MSDDAKAWFIKADADHASAHWEMQAPRVNCNAVIFHAQQCIEKLLKGLLIAADVPFERTHELNVLAHLVHAQYPTWVWSAADLATLQPGAVLLRYPGYDATPEDSQRAIEACDRLRASLLSLV